MSRVLTFAFAFALVASACAAPPTTPGTSAAPTGAASATPAPVRGGTAIVAIWQFPATLAAHYANQTVTDIVNNGVIEGLAETTTDGKYIPTLATRVPDVANGGVVIRGTKMDVTWELKPGIKWSDGAPLTSADIKYTWEIWMKDPKVNNRTGFSDIESIDTPNDLTAVVHYKSVYAPYPLNFFSLMPKHLLEKEADISRTEYVRKPLGTGPFKVTDFKTDESITLEKNTNYRDASKPYLDKIIFKSVPSSQVGLAQLKAGEVHAMWNLTEAQTPEVEKETSLSLLVVQGPTVERIELNTAQNKEYPDPTSTHPVLGDIAVRKALLYATPKQQIIDKLLFGKAKPGASPVSQGWAAYSQPQEAYDQAKANKTLDDAGWVKGSDGIRSKGGVRASLTYATTTGDQLRERVQQVLVEEWKAVGIEVKIQNQPSAVILSGSCAGKDPRKLGTFDLLMYASTPSIDPHSTILPRYHSKQIPTQADCSGQNYTRFKDPTSDKAIEEAGSTLDLEKRKSSYASVMKALNDAYVIIWMYDRANIDARRTELQGWNGNTWRRFTWNVQDWWLKK
jgi:peptide/nickel transport system substrate-binding protein